MPIEKQPGGGGKCRFCQIVCRNNGSLTRHEAACLKKTAPNNSYDEDEDELLETIDVGDLLGDDFLAQKTCSVSELLAAIPNVTACIDEAVMKSRSVYVAERRANLDSKIDLFSSDEDANRLSSANDMQARKEAREKFPASERSERLKACLASFDSKLKELNSVLKTMRDLVDAE